MTNALLAVGDSLQLLRRLPANSIDACVTDPPYHLIGLHKRYEHAAAETELYAAEHSNPYNRTSKGFMGQEWDGGDIAFDAAFWREVYRVLKPGGHLLAFGGTRTYHRMVGAIEDAEFQIRDCIAFAWVYSTGFPKSHNVALAIDKRKGLIGHRGKRLVNGFKPQAGEQGAKTSAGMAYTTPISDEAKAYDGFGTGLKPAFEPIVLARKPLDGTLLANVLRLGTGGLNIDGCRIDAEPAAPPLLDARARTTPSIFGAMGGSQTIGVTHQGRWPANLIFDEHAAAALDHQVEGASRFFYVPKPTRWEKNAGLDETFPERRPDPRSEQAAGLWHEKGAAAQRNHHPCVKPLTLMRHLCRLVTPPNGIVLDPFCGSGSTGCAAVLEGFQFVGFDGERKYIEIAAARIDYWSRQQQNGVIDDEDVA